MSEFASLSNALSKLNIYKPVDFVSEASLPSLATKQGVLGVQLNKDFVQIRKCVDLLSKSLEKVSGGPVVEIGEIYESITKISERINSVIGELDTSFPQEYYCKPIFDKAMSTIGQLAQYVPHLISTNAPSLAQYIANFQQICVTTNQLFDQIIGVYQSVPLLIESIVKPLPSSSPIHNLLIGALIHLSHSITADFICFAQETNVKSSEPTVLCLQAWQTILQNFSSQLQIAIGQPHAQVVNAVSYVSVEPTTSLFETLNAVHAASPNSFFFEDATVHALAFTQFLNEIEYIEFTEMANDLASNISNYITSPGKPTDELFQRAQVLVAILSNRLKATRFGIPTGDCMSAVFGLSVSLPGYQTNMDELTLLVAQALIVYGGVCGLRKDGLAILNTLYTQILSILSHFGKQLQDISTEINTIVASNETAFNVKKLGGLNYHVKRMAAVDLPLGDNFLDASKRIAGFTGCINKVIATAVDNVSQEDVQTQLKDLSARANVIGVQYVRWMQKAVLCLNMAVESRGEILAALLSQFAPLRTQMQAMPRFLAFEVGAESRLITAVADAVKQIPSLLETVQEENIKSALKQISEESFPAGNCFQSFTQVADQMDFTAAVAGLNSLSLPYYTLAKQIISAVPQAFSYAFATAYTQTMLVTYLIESLQSFSTRLIAYPPSVRGALDVMWPSASGLAYGHPSANKDNLAMYLTSIDRTVQEIDNSIAQMQQPTIAYEISDTLKQVRAMESSVSSLPAALKETAKEALKMAWKTPEGIPIVEKWFEVAKSGCKDPNEAAGHLIEELIKYIGGTKSDTIYQEVAATSVAFAGADFDDESVEHFLDGLAIKLLETSLRLAKHRSKARLLLELAYEGIHSIKMRNLKSAEIENHVTAALLGIAESYSDIVNKGVTPQLLAASFSAIAKYRALNALFENVSLVKEDADRIEHDLEAMIKASAAKDVQSLYKNACKMYNKRCRTAFAKALGTNLDFLVDSVYDYSELSRTTANAILKESKNAEEGLIYINSTLRRFVSSTASVISISERALESLRRNKTMLMETHIQGSSEILQSLPPFIENAYLIGTKQADQIDLPLRRSNRNIAKQVDSFINFIEAPPREGAITEPFDKLRVALYSAIGAMEFDVAKFLSEAALATSKDMLSHSDTPKSVQKMNDAYKAMEEKAVGKTKKNFELLFNQLQKNVSNFFDSEPDFSLPFPPEPVVSAAARVGSSLARFMLAAEEATDVLVIDPDPDSAAEIPEAFKAPVVSASTISAAEAYPEQAAIYIDLTNAIAALKEQTSKEVPMSEEILEKVDLLTKLAEKYCQAALTTAAGTPDAHAKIEQQTDVHTLAASVTALFTALKAFFLRTGNFEAELKEAYNGMTTATNVSNKAGEAAAKIAAPEDEDESTEVNDDDEVTAELRASAKSIMDMSKRLAAFGAQLNVAEAEEVVIDEDFDDDDELEDGKDDPQDAVIDLAAEEGTLAAFVLQNSQPVMNAAGNIVVRAQEICSQLRGLIKNERLLIKCAQDLSEAAELMIIAFEIIMQAVEKDPEFKVIASARIVRTACAKLVAQVRQEGDDPEGVMEANIRTVRYYTAIIIKKIDKLTRKKWRTAQEASKKKVMNKMVERMNAGAKLQEFQRNLQNEEDYLKQLMRK